MNDEPNSRRNGANNPSAKARPTQSRASGMKWLAGAAAAAVLLGGGYYAWSHSAQNQTANNEPTTELADNSASFSAPSEFATAANEPTTVEQGAAIAPAPDMATTHAAPLATKSMATAKAPTKKTQTAALEVPEQVIGVSTVEASATDSDELIVRGARRPVWRYQPSATRLSEYYPAFALERGREGEASLHCTVGEKGALQCATVSEYPAKAGFGRAALQVARTFRHADTRSDGSRAYGTPVNLRVMFRMAEDERRRT
jgi:TonB family protein